VGGARRPRPRAPQSPASARMAAAICSGPLTTLTASKRQAARHESQRTQSDWSMRCASFLSPLIAPTGHFFAHSVQPVHRSGSIEKAMSASQAQAGQRCSSMWATYSSLK